jgi:threonine/homoserine/homoserine lactone efflux protein
MGNVLGQLVGLVAFGFVISVTPGPNNTLLWTSGARFGFRRTVPLVAATSLGIGSMALASAAGLGAVVVAMPAAALVLKVVGSAYLLYLAYRIAFSGAMHRSSTDRPLNLAQALLFQWVNPKGWIFALAAVSAFRPPQLPIAAGSALVIATMMVVVIPSAVLWAAGGTLISRFLSGDRTRRAVSVVLALLLVASVAQLWV